MKDLWDGVAVVGMHRSGTSLVASVLAGMGYSVGPGRMLKAQADNPRGFYELREMVRLNEDALWALGGRWDDPPARDAIEGWSLPLSWYFEAWTWARQALGEPSMVLKDPRLALLLPQWARLIGWPRATVGVIRNPVEVAQSLAARNGIVEDHAISLWWRYNEAASSLPAHSGVFVFLDDLLSSPTREIERLMAELPPPIRGFSGAPSLHAGLIESSLVHHRTPPWRRLSPHAREAVERFEAAKIEIGERQRPQFSAPKWVIELRATRPGDHSRITRPQSAVSRPLAKARISRGVKSLTGLKSRL